MPQEGRANPAPTSICCGWFAGAEMRAEILSYEKAMLLASRDEAFKATVYAMNTLLVHKGIYTQDEFQKVFVEWVEKEEAKKARARH